MKKCLAGLVLTAVLAAFPPSGAFSAGEDPGAAGLTLPGECAIRILKDRDYFRDLLRALDGAQQEIVICAYLFRANGYPDGYPDRVVERLLRAAGRGVRVEVILERSEDRGDAVNRDNEATRLRLERGGIRAKMDSPRRTTHAKLAVVDRRYTFVGSHNLTHSALKYNREFSVLIDSPTVAEEALRYIRTIVPED